MKRRGTGLVAVVTVATLVGAFIFIVLGLAGQARQSMVQRQYRLQAHALALSGLDYARAMVAHRRWTKATRFETLGLGGGSFAVEAAPSGGGWQLRCLGRSGNRQETLESRVAP